MICVLFSRSFLGSKAIASVTSLGLLMGAAASFGQISSSIDGHVVDPSGRGIPNASVTISSSALGTTREASADSKGEFLVQGLPPGFYGIKISAPGFATEEVRAAEVLVNQALTPTITMSVASANSEVTVTAVTPALETTASSTGTTITPRQIEDMPINGRNYLDLMPAGTRRCHRTTGEYWQRCGDTDSRRTRRQRGLPDRWSAE